MQITRRALVGSGAAMLTAGPLLARSPKAPAAGWFDRAIVIDGLGGLNDPYTEGEISRLSDRAFAEMMQTGVTVLRDTVMPVGNVADPWADYRKYMDHSLQFFAANPDRLLLVRSAADILKAKREKKFGVVIGTQDTAMVGGDLDRIATMKKDGVTSVQVLTTATKGRSRSASDRPVAFSMARAGARCVPRTI